MNNFCPVSEDHNKKCAIVGSDLINSFGKYISRPISPSDIGKIIDMGSNILYNEEETLRGNKKSLAVNLTNSGSWIRFNVSHLNQAQVQFLLDGLDCR